MRKSFAMMLVVVAMLAVGAAQQKSAQDKKVDAAVKTAESWLGTIDAGNYGESWDQSSSMFKSAITREKLIEALQQARTPLGKESARKLWGSEHKDSLPNAPAGEYVVMQFNTNFDNKSGAVETVTMVLEKDGKWRAAGYYIR
ncbi:MAG TPA: DUF4019 domain-containing protein [candidate division Zixibacteria bacterium]|nr:DUF4019 domain-containing protein [candidate division Zixibacteria bacterium]